MNMTTIQTPKTKDETTPPANFFLRTISELRRGLAVNEASEELAAVVKEVKRTGKPGEVTLKLKLTPSGDGESLYIDDDLSAKAPKMPRRSTTFFMTEEGGLQRDNPKQTEMFGVVDQATVEETNDHAVNQ